VTADLIERPTEFRWDRLTAAAALGYCLLVATQSVGVVLGELREQFGMSGVIAAMHGSAFGFGLLVCGLRGVAIIERFGRLATLQGSGGAMLAGVILFCFGPNWQATLAGATLAGFGGAMLVVVMPGLISDHHGPHRAAAFAAANGVPGVAGVAFSLVIGATLASGASWRVSYLVLTGAIFVALALIAHPVDVPSASAAPAFTLRLFRNPDVLIPYLCIVNAVLTEFTIGVWSVTYLKEVGQTSGGVASTLGALFGLMMFLGRLILPFTMRLLGDATLSVSFCVLIVGCLVMCLAPGVAAKAVGLAIVGLGGAALYPLNVDRLYRRADGQVDSVSLGAIAALASGTAVLTGPLLMGVVADIIDLRWAILVVPTLAVIGAITQRPRPQRPQLRPDLSLT
jgi:predicted MFS family arabinose efflux permease